MCFETRGLTPIIPCVVSLHGTKSQLLHEIHLAIFRTEDNPLVEGCSHPQTQLPTGEEASCVAEEVTIEEEEVTHEAGAETIHSTSPKIVFLHANCMARPTIRSSSAISTLIPHTWGKRRQHIMQSHTMWILIVCRFWNY
jgi:hypothetical protein